MLWISWNQNLCRHAFHLLITRYLTKTDLLLNESWHFLHWQRSMSAYLTRVLMATAWTKTLHTHATALTATRVTPVRSTSTSALLILFVAMEFALMLWTHTIVSVMMGSVVYIVIMKSAWHPVRTTRKFFNGPYDCLGFPPGNWRMAGEPFPAAHASPPVEKFLPTPLEITEVFGRPYLR